MTQSELAVGLGIDPAMVSRLKRRGMPVDSLEAAQAWRQRHVAPYAKSQPSTAARPARAQADIGAPPAAQSRPRAGRPQTLKELLTGEPPAHPADVIEAMVREHVLLPRAVLQPLIEAVDEVVQALLQAGMDAAMIRPVLCELLHHQPQDERRLSEAAWRVAAGLDELAAVEADDDEEAQ